LKEPDRIKEKNWFFKLSAYQTFLEDFYATYPAFATPGFRFNEIKAFVDQ
jgi:methionyl-tRNA synthetase